MNDTSQQTVATWFRCAGTFEHYFIKIYCWVCFERIFKIAQLLSKLWGSWLPQVPYAPERIITFHTSQRALATRPVNKRRN